MLPARRCRSSRGGRRAAVRADLSTLPAVDPPGRPHLQPGARRRARSRSSKSERAGDRARRRRHVLAPDVDSAGTRGRRRAAAPVLERICASIRGCRERRSARDLRSRICGRVIATRLGCTAPDRHRRRPHRLATSRPRPTAVPQVYLIYDQRDAEAIAPWADACSSAASRSFIRSSRGTKPRSASTTRRTCALRRRADLLRGRHEAWLRRKLRELQKSAGYGRTGPTPVVGDLPHRAADAREGTVPHARSAASFRQWDGLRAGRAGSRSSRALQGTRRAELAR